MDTIAANVPSTPRPSGMWNLRNGFVVLLYALVALWGIVQLVIPTHGFILYGYGLLMASVATTWVSLDARFRRHYIPSIVYLLVMCAWPVALPIYLIAVKGWRGLGWSLLHACGLLVALNVCFYATYEVLLAIGSPVEPV